MGKEMRELHQVEKIASELIRTGQVSWIEAIELAKEKIRGNNLEIKVGDTFEEI